LRAEGVLGYEEAALSRQWNTSVHASYQHHSREITHGFRLITRSHHRCTAEADISFVAGTEPHNRKSAQKGERLSHYKTRVGGQYSWGNYYYWNK